MYIPSGLRSLPRNFRRLVFSTSVLHGAELVPGLAGTSFFNLDSINKAFEQERQSTEINVKVSAYLGITPLFLFWRLPGLFYRFSLKSTSWFWWPLGLLAGELRKTDADELVSTKTRDWLAKISILLAVGTIISFIWANLISTGKIFKVNPNPLLTVIGYLLLIDGVPPWQLLLLAVAILTLIIALCVDRVGRLHKIRQKKIRQKRGDAASVARAERQIAWIDWFVRLQRVLLIVFLLMFGGQAILYFNSLKCWCSLPANVEYWAKLIYSSKFPHAQCIGS